MSRFWKACLICFGVFVLLNVASYYLLSTPQSEVAGFPRYFWRNSQFSSSFRPVNFAFDLFLAIYFSYRIGRWYEQRGTPDYIIGTKV